MDNSKNDPSPDIVEDAIPSPDLREDSLEYPDFLEDPRPFKAQSPLAEESHDSYARGALRSFDVFAFIVNKMVGTGIYTTPATVFLMTGHKGLTLGLFGIGFIYSIVSMLIYLDYAKVLPFNGGELVYLSEITSYVSADNIHAIARPPNTQNGIPLQDRGANGDQSRPALRARTTNTTTTSRNGSARRWKRFKRHSAWLAGDGLLPYIVYSFGFVIFFNSATNSMTLGRMVLLCIGADKTDNNVPADINRDLMRFIGVFVLSIICLLQYFSPSFGRSLNKTLVVIKLGCLIGLFFVGVAATSRQVDIDRKADWYRWNDVKGGKVSFAKALLAVLFSFQGWENATFVAGEIPRHKHKILRRGFISGVLTVGCLYLLVVAVFLHSVTWDDIAGDKTNTDYPPMLTGNGIKAKRAWTVIIAISCFGSLNAIIYTYSRVKQAIGQAQIFPWSRFLKQDDTLQRTFDGALETEFHYKAPQGGLAIEWLVGVVFISASAAIKSTVESASLPGYLQAYSHCLILMVLSMGFFNLKSREEALWARDSPTRRKDRGRLGRFVLSICVILSIFTNLAILVINFIPPYSASDGSKFAFPGFGFPVMVGAVVIVGTAYYLLFFGAARRLYERHQPSPDESEAVDMSASAPSQPQTVPKILRSESPWNLMRLANVQCEIRKNYVYGMGLERVYRFGRRWRIIYHVPEDPNHRSSNPNVPPAGKVTMATFLYWFFGGTRLNDDWNPRFIVKQRWNCLRQRLRNLRPIREPAQERRESDEIDGPHSDGPTAVDSQPSRPGSQ